MGPKNLYDFYVNVSLRAIVRLCVSAGALYVAFRGIYPVVDWVLSIPHLVWDRDFSLTNPSVLLPSRAHLGVSSESGRPLLPIFVFVVPMLASARFRGVAFAGAFAGYVAGWWAAFALVGAQGTFPWGLWTVKSLLVAVIAIAFVAVFEPLLVVIERWLNSPKLGRYAGAMVSVGLVAASYSSVLGFVRERLDLRTDRTHMRHLYRALLLYEQDNDSQSAPSLADVAPAYIDPEELASPADERAPPPRGLYPANLYIFKGPGSERLVPYKVSYAYAKPFESEIARRMTWQTLQESPNAAILANTHYRYLTTTRPALTFERPHGVSANRGPIMRIMSDGSLKVVDVPRAKVPTVGGDAEILFFAGPTGYADWSLFASPTSATVASRTPGP